MTPTAERTGALAKLAAHVYCELQSPDGGPGTCSIEVVRNFLAEARVTPGMHVGRPAEEFDDAMTIEWWLGQIASIIDEEQWFAMNSVLNWGASNIAGVG